MNSRKIISFISGFIGVAGVLLAPVAMSASPGKGWDTFHMGQGEPIPVAATDHKAASSSASAGKGWDTFHMGQGEPIPVAATDHKAASSSASAGKGWDTFHMGLGDSL
ncbi:MAG: hypothetical protein ACYCY9_04890 [Thiobacillus sp.]